MKILLAKGLSNIVWLYLFSSAAAAASLQSGPTLCDPMDGSPPDSPVPGVLQPRTLEWVAISFSKASKWKVKVKSLSRVRLLATPWTAAYQAPPSMGVSRQVYWSGLPLPSPSFLVHGVNHCLNSLLSFLCKSHSFPPKYSAQTVNPHSFKLIKEYIYFVFFSEIFLPYQSSLLLSRPIP